MEKQVAKAAFRLGRNALNDRQVFFLHSPRGYCRGERSSGLCGPGVNHHASRGLVKPVDAVALPACLSAQLFRHAALFRHKACRLDADQKLRIGVEDFSLH